jgi:hypothetical protein
MNRPMNFMHVVPLAFLTLFACGRSRDRPRPQPVVAVDDQRVDVPAAAHAKQSGEATASGWVSWTHPQKLISAKFPAQPKEEETVVPTVLGPVKFISATATHDPGLFLAGATRYSIPRGSTFNVAKALNAARDHMLTTVNGTLALERPLTLDGMQGREIDFSAPGANGTILHGAARVFASADPPSSYTAIAIQAEEADIFRFFESVHLHRPIARR